MAGLLFLVTSDYHIEESVVTKGGLLLCNNIRGLSFVLFYSPGCEHCSKLIPIFKRFPGQISGIQFGITLVNSDVVRASQRTVAPIEYVPLMILYVNGRPYMRYNQGYTEDELKNFVIETGNRLRSRDSFVKGANQATAAIASKRIPNYSLGQPLLGDDELDAYLKYDEFEKLANISVKV